MHALSVKQPWAWAIVFGGKNVENRTWRPPQHFIGQRIAIHASRAFDKSAYQRLRLFSGGLHAPLPSQFDFPRGVIVGTVRLVGICGGFDDLGYSWHEAGCTGWLLADPRPAPEVLARLEVQGRLGLWPVPNEVERMMREGR